VTAASPGTGRSELGLSVASSATVRTLYTCPALLSADRYIMDVSMVLVDSYLDSVTWNAKSCGKVGTDMVLVSATIAMGR
jgi:hypothetical protein